LEERTRKYDGDKWDRFKKERAFVLPVVTLRKSNIEKESKWFDKEAFNKSRVESANTNGKVNQQNSAIGPYDSSSSHTDGS